MRYCNNVTRTINMVLVLILGSMVHAAPPNMLVMRMPRLAQTEYLKDAPEANTHPVGNNPVTLGFENFFHGKARKSLDFRQDDGVNIGTHIAKVINGAPTQLVPPTDPAKLAAFQAILPHKVNDGVPIYFNVDWRDGKSFLFVWLHVGQGIAYWDRYGCDIYRYNLETDVITRITTQDWNDNDDVNILRTLRKERDGSRIIHEGVWNSYPCVLPNGDIAYTSNRLAYTSHRIATFPDRLFRRTMGRITVCDSEGKNIRNVGFLNMGYSGAINLRTNPHTGGIAFMSSESAGGRSQNGWGLWEIMPDGSNFHPLMSAFEIGPGTGAEEGFNWPCFTKNNVLLSYYYNGKNRGYGNLLRFPYGAMHDSPRAWENTALTNNGKAFGPFPFQPIGIDSPLGAFLDWEDTSRNFSRNVTYTDAQIEEKLVSPFGKASQAQCAPGNQVWYGHAKFYGSGSNFHMWSNQIWAFEDKPGTDVNNRVIYRDDAYHLWLPKPMATWQELYGKTPPVYVDPHATKPTLTALIGTSSLLIRESEGSGIVHQDNDPTKPVHWRSRKGKTRFTGGTMKSGGDTILPSTDPDPVVRLAAMNAILKDGGSISFINQYPVRNHTSKDGEPGFKANGEVWGEVANVSLMTNADSSILFKAYGMSPYTFQLKDKWGRCVVRSDTWRQEGFSKTRTNCNGCHAHNKPAPVFAGTYADLNRDKMVDATRKAVIPTWSAVKAILTAKCGSCHSDGEEAGLVWSLTDDRVTNDRKYLNPNFSVKSDLLSAAIEGRMPKDPLLPKLTLDEIKLIAMWIDFGMSMKDGVLTDREPPLCKITYPQPGTKSDKVEFVTHDRQGVVANVQVWVDGVAVPNAQLTSTPNEDGDPVYRYMLGSVKESGTVRVRITDDTDNVFNEIRTFGSGVVVVPDPDPDPDPEPPAKDWKKLFEQYLERIEALAREMRAELGDG